jgi:hypothetical protein
MALFISKKWHFVHVFLWKGTIQTDVSLLDHLVIILQNGLAFKEAQDLRGLHAGQLACVLLHNNGIDGIAHCNDDKAL